MGDSTSELRATAFKLRTEARELKGAVAKSEWRAAELARQFAEELSQGPFTLSQLRRMGHPYRRGGSPPQDPAIINYDDEKKRKRGTVPFRNAWRVIPPTLRGGRMTTELVNDAPHAQFLFRGTSRMIPRPILALVARRLAPIRRAMLAQALRDLDR